MGIAMGSSDDVPLIVSIYEVHALTHTIFRLDLDDRDTTECLRKILIFYEDNKLALILTAYLFWMSDSWEHEISSRGRFRMQSVQTAFQGTFWKNFFREKKEEPVACSKTEPKASSSA